LPASSSASSTRRAHLALVAVFVAFGGIEGTWAARLPAIKQHLGFDNGRLGIAIFAVSVTATLALPFAGWLAARYGSRWPAGMGVGVAGSGLVAAAFAPSLFALVPAACVLGAGLGIADVAANAHGVALEHRAGRPLLSALHGAWSFGLLGGSGVAAGAAAASIGPRAQFTVVAAGVVVAMLIAVPKLLRGTASDVDSARFALPRGALALPALLMFCCLFVESGAINWSAVFLNGPAGASAAVAAGGVVVFAFAMAFARLVGDRLLLRWGIGGLAVRGGTISCIGMVLAIATRTPASGLIGLALVGIGMSAIVPALFRVATTTAGVSHGAGIAAVATSGYIGGVINGPAIGFLARGIGLSAALGLVAAAAAVIALLGPRLGSRA
jgi:hypothetical protein